MDADAILRLLLSHRAMVTGYIAFLVRDPHLVEDVFQEVALTVLKKAEQLECEEAFGAWVRTIARYKSLHALAKRSRAPGPIPQSLLESLEAAWQSRDGDAASLRAEALGECLEKLTPRSQQILHLRFTGNLCGQELAQRLDRPLNTVYVALSRIYRNLAECIERRLAQEGYAHG
jgi:RNA polymerase sigma-70 factor, ECF subfamily